VRTAYLRRGVTKKEIESLGGEKRILGDQKTPRMGRLYLSSQGKKKVFFKKGTPSYLMGREMGVGLKRIAAFHQKKEFWDGKGGCHFSSRENGADDKGRKEFSKTKKKGMHLTLGEKKRNHIKLK